MAALFSFDVDSDRDLVRIGMSGFFTPSDIEAFLEARRAAHAKLSCARNAHVTLNDVRGMKIQSSEAVELFRQMLAAPEYRSRRLAFIVAPTLARMQLERLLDGREARCFEDPAEAEAWLFAKSEPTRAAA
jgi:hypothetical protein